MSLNIKNSQVERLATEVAELAGETKTEAIRRALLDRRERLVGATHDDQAERLNAFLEREVWPRIPAAVRGRRLTKKQHERILGYRSDGV